MSEESSERRANPATADDDATPDGTDSDVDQDGQVGDEEAATTPEDTDESAGSPADDTDLASRVEEYDADLAGEVAAVESRLAEAESELEAKDERIDELEDALARSKADFKNYKKRAKRREEEIRERATEDFVGRIVSVRDNLVRALEQEEGADIRPGVESTVEEFDRILAEENVSEISPEIGADVDPTRHEVLMRVDADQPEGTVAEVYRPGYEMAGSVIREAQVTVSEGGSDDGDADDGNES
ncbi:nucleotide exchange factor GrpE [Halobellus ruber]|uniref:Protein GrpE n=1 Tax=Halobellus ruber TaxID=2761102 RepID=A0A7J9SER6_9EURY|nr:nucleotide exchange factor GrpE [Halobellus ruber]